ncbi:MAG: beta-lactamase family protein [Oscillospiraceae bacterium]|nr:beta-lactamase family protein [Oscillospiraceae bacterium]
MKRYAKILSALTVSSVMLFSTNISAFAEDSMVSDWEKAITEYSEGTVFASCQTALFDKNEILYTGRFGYSDIENEIPADENSVYDWGSISKTLVWVSMMQLYEQGKLDLNEDIRTYLPEGFLSKLKYDDPITILNLMNHQCGWEETNDVIETSDKNGILPLDEALRKSEPYQVFRPGEITGYSNWGTALGGYIVECITGESYTNYIHEHIFDVLGMEHTSISPDHSDTPWVAERYEKMKAYNSNNIHDEQIMVPIAKKTYIIPYPAGAAAGTIDDIALYGKALISDECPLFENQETLELMFSPSLNYGDSDIVQNCHGFWTSFYSRTLLGHNGATNTGTANLVFDRESGTGCAVLVNQYGESYFTQGIPAMLFGSAKDNLSLTENRNGNNTDISGNYIISRSVLTGISAIPSFISTYKIQKSDDETFTLNDSITLSAVDDALFFTEAEDSVAPCGLSYTSDGRKLLSLGSADLVEAPDIPLKRLAVYGYLLIAAVEFILLIIKWIRVIVKKWNRYRGWQCILLSQIAKIVSCVSVFLMFVFYIDASGISEVNAGITAAIQILSLIFCIISLAASAICMIQKKEKKAAQSIYISNILLNAASIVLAVSLKLWIP